MLQVFLQPSLLLELSFPFSARLREASWMQPEVASVPS